MRGKKKSKKRTHVALVPDATIPRSFIIKSGETSNAVSTLVQELRLLMEPNTATNLKERKGNKIKDFLMIAGQLMVSHLIVFSKSGNGGVNMRIGRIPKGPTLTFHVENYALIRDVLKIQTRPKSAGNDQQVSPLVVLNNFGSSDNHIVLMATVLQNMFPAIKVSQMKLADAKRVVLFNLNLETDLIEMRHYRITVKTLGISKSVKSIIQTSIPNLQGYEDISDFIMKGAFATESDVEDAPDTVILPKDDMSEKRAIKLFELGPRMDLKLIKIQDGLCGGEVIHHSFVEKTASEKVDLKKRKDKARIEKTKRREEQERNVKKKVKQSRDEADKEEIEFNEDDFDDLIEMEEAESEAEEALQEGADEDMEEHEEELKDDDE